MSTEENTGSKAVLQVVDEEKPGRQKLWVLRPIGWPNNYDTDIFRYDCSHGFIIRARSVATARKVAAGKAADEHGIQLGNPWLYREMTTCQELKDYGSTIIIMQDFNAG